MRYYVVSDIHGFCAELKQTLRKAGYFEDSEPHKLVLLGDPLDRGEEALEMEEFILTLMKRDELILIPAITRICSRNSISTSWRRNAGRRRRLCSTAWRRAPCSDCSMISAI